MILEPLVPRSLSNSNCVSQRKGLKPKTFQKDILLVRDRSQHLKDKKQTTVNTPNSPHPSTIKEKSKRQKNNCFLPPLNPNHQPSIDIASKQQPNNKQEIKQRSNKRHLTFNQNKENTISINNMKNELKANNILEKRRSSYDLNKREVAKDDDVLSYDTNKNSIKYLQSQKQNHFISSKMFIHFKSFSCQTLAGVKENGFEKINQDCMLHIPMMFKNKDMNMFGIFDGHGDDGHLISSFLQKYVEGYFCKNELLLNSKGQKEMYDVLIANNYYIIKQCFFNAEKELKRRSLEINVYESGSTCLLLIQIGNKIFCANVGDSRGIMVTSKKMIIPLSIDHKPDLPNEQNRIEKCGGTVLKDEGNGPFRVWKENKDYPGLAMSRSLGDFDAKLVGVIPDPDVFEFSLDGTSKYIILGSDGIWEFLDNEQVAQLGKGYYMSHNPDEYCNKLISEACLRWKLEGNRRDDISAIVIFL